MRRIAAIVFVLFSTLAGAQSFRITAVTPAADLLPGDNATFAISAVREGVRTPQSARVVLREINAKTGVLIRELTASGSETSGVYRFQIIYRVPFMSCYGAGTCTAGQTLQSTELRVRLEFVATLTTSDQGTLTSAPFPLAITYPAVSPLSVSTQPLNTFNRTVRVTVKGANFQDGKSVSVLLMRSNNALKFLYTSGPEIADPYEYWFIPRGTTPPSSAYRVVAPDTIELSINSIVGVAAFDSEASTRDYIGGYDVSVRWQQPASPGISRSATDIFTPNLFTVTPPLTNDSTTITQLEVTMDSTNPDPKKRGTAVWTPGGANTLIAEPRGYVVVKLTGTYNLARYGAGLLWVVMRDKATKQNLYMPWDFARNTAGKEREIVEQGSGRHTPLQMTYRLPAQPGDLEFFLVMTPQDHPTPTNYDRAPTVPFGETFGQSAIVSVTWLPADAVPAGPPPRQTTDSRFITSTGPGIMTPCRKRSGGPIEIPIEITRVMGDEIASDGRLLFIDQMVGRGVISRTARLKISSFGRRLQGSGPRRDRVYLNDKELTVLTTVNEGWTSEYAAEIDTGLLRFPARVARSSPVPRRNILRIEVDAGDAAAPENWCTSVGWAELAFNAMAPVVFVHGNGQGDDGLGGDFWEGKVLNSRDEERLDMKMAFLTPFRRDKFPIYSDISMPTQSTAEHGKLLGILIPSAAREFGARHVHIVTHSKGGLDSRDFMARFVPPNFGIYSLHTVSGPHQGSPGPDYQLDAVGASATYSDDSVRTEIGALSPPNAGTLSLRVSEVAKFNERNLPALPTDQSVDGVKHTVQYRALSGDMNLDGSTNFATGNPTISYDETYGLPGQGFKPDSLWTSVLQTAYRIVGYVASTYTEEKKIFDGRRGETITYKVVREKLNPTFLQNDICVTRNAAKVGVIQELYYGKANHSTVASPDFAEKVLDSIRKIQPINVEIP